MAAKPPIILISGSATDSKSVTAIMASVRAMGCEPMLITNHMARLEGLDANAIRAQIHSDLAKADGVIVMGNNNDIDPSVYGEQANAHTKSEAATPEGQARAAYEYALIHDTIAQKKPLFGICAGMQRINVMTGGTLHQHVPDLFKTGAEAPGTPEDNRHAQDINAIAPYIPVEFIHVEPGTKMAEIAKDTPGMYAPAGSQVLPEGVMMVNTMHHQSVNLIGNGMRVNARSIELDRPDIQVIEGLEVDPKGRFAGQTILATQWHPEFGESELSAKVLRAFADSTREYAVAHPRAQDHSTMLDTVASIEPDKQAALAQKYHAAPGSWADYVVQRQQQAAVQKQIS